MTDTKVEPAFIVGQHDRNSEIQAIQTISVSIPSRAGRLGQRATGAAVIAGGLFLFQSPQERGGWVNLDRNVPALCSSGDGFNPLKSGAVGSTGSPLSHALFNRRFQSPQERGGWVNTTRTARMNKLLRYWFQSPQERGGWVNNF